MNHASFDEGCKKALRVNVSVFPLESGTAAHLATA